MVQTGTTLREPAQFRSLLVPIDLSPGSDRVVGRVSLLTLADDVRVTLKFGAASKEIGSCATQTKAELIVMGRGGGAR